MSPKVGASPYAFRVGSKMSLYPQWNKYTKQDEGYEVGEELPMFYNGQVVGHVRITAQHRAMFSNSYYWTAVRTD